MQFLLHIVGGEITSFPAMVLAELFCKRSSDAVIKSKTCTLSPYLEAIRSSRSAQSMLASVK